MDLLAKNKGRPMQGIVEQVRDGSTIRVYLLPEFQFVQVFVAGIQCPTMGRRAATDAIIEPENNSDESNGESIAEPRPPLTSAQRLAASAASSTEVAPDPFGREAKHFTETRVLSRDVRIVLEGVDRFSNLIGSVYYADGDTPKDLAMELVENGLAKFVEWSANMMDEGAKRKLKSAELQAKKDRLRIWTNYVPPASNSKAIHNQNFTGKVVEVVSGDCIIVADDALPYGSPLAERRVNLSSIRCPKMGNPRRNEKPAPFARETKEFLRTRLIGRQVNVSMEYARKVPMADGSVSASGSSDSRVMDFGSVFMVSQSKPAGDDAPSAVATAGGQQLGQNVAALLVSRGLATLVKHRDFEERSNYYDALLDAERQAINSKKGMHSEKAPPADHNTDLTTASAKKAKDFLPFLQKVRRHAAVVEYVLSGHRFKLLVPGQTCSIAFSFSGVRCPGRDEPYSDEAIALMRRKVLQRDVEIEVETVDRTGTFLGSLWESKKNVALVLLEAGLARIQTTFGIDRIADGHLLVQAEELAKQQKLKIWEGYVEGQEVANGSAAENKQKEVLQAVVTEILDGGRFYVQVGDQMTRSIQEQLASLNLGEAPVIGTFNPKKGDVVLAQFSADNSWNRAMIVTVPSGGVVKSPQDEFEVFYVDYGNQEKVPYSRLRPTDSSVLSTPGLAKLCSLAYLRVPSLADDGGEDAALYLSERTLTSGRTFKARIEDRDTSGGTAKGQGTGTILIVTLLDAENDSSINEEMLKEGYARLEKPKRFESKEKRATYEKLKEIEEAAKKDHIGIWKHGDIGSDDEEYPPPTTKKSGGRR
ncbi:Translin-1 [Dionaea muscipula]